jgi:hypothetical protein
MRVDPKSCKALQGRVHEESLWPAYATSKRSTPKNRPCVTAIYAERYLSAAIMKSTSRREDWDAILAKAKQRAKELSLIPADDHSPIAQVLRRL